MSNTSPPARFGVSLDPAVVKMAQTFERAQLAETHGLDLLTIMDHPYLQRLFETWTLLTAIAMKTERIHLATNVANLPLRPPAMLAKMTATLDVLSRGRVELGLGAGAMWDQIVAFGGPRRTPGEAYAAFKEALHILRGMWDHREGDFSYEGDIYQVTKAHPGPAPAHRIPIWVGAQGPRMLRLIGEKADGLLVSTIYVPPARLLEFNQWIDEGAEAVGRDPAEVRRGYNLMGILDLGREDTKIGKKSGDNIYGPSQAWVEAILRLHHDYRQDTFIFWPEAGNQMIQVEAFAQEVVPAVKEALSNGG